jgi:hypothetical protein
LEFWLQAIARTKQAIFYGPPGTGKTYITKKLAQHLIGGGDGFVELVQFHPAYAYEEPAEFSTEVARDSIVPTYPKLNACPMSEGALMCGTRSLNRGILKSSAIMKNTPQTLKRIRFSPGLSGALPIAVCVRNG